MAAGSRSSRGLRSSRGSSPGSSPQRASSAGNSPPSAAAAAGSAGALGKHMRRSSLSRLSDPASSSCSSIKSLVSHSRQQQQLRRTSSNSSLGSAGGMAAPVMRVLGAAGGGGGSPGGQRGGVMGSADQQGLLKPFGLKQQQHGIRPRRASLGSSPNRTSSSSQWDQQQRGVFSPGADCSPPQAPAASSLAGFSTPPGCPLLWPAAKAATVGPQPSGPMIRASSVQHGLQAKSVMWKSLGDFVHHNMAAAATTQGSSSGSTHSSPGLRRGAVGGSMAAGLVPPFLSPPAAVLANPWASPPAAGVGHQGVVPLPPAAGSSGRASRTLSPQGSVGSRLGSPAAAVTPAAAVLQSKEGVSAAGGQLAGVLVLPVAEGVCEGVSDADSPDSRISDSAAVAEGSGDEGCPDAWRVQENPVYFELH